MGLKKSDKKDLVLGLYNNKDNKYSKRSLVKTIGISESCLYYESTLNSKDLIVKQEIEEFNNPEKMCVQTRINVYGYRFNNYILTKCK